MSLIVKGNLKEVAVYNDKNMSVSKDFIEKLEIKVDEIIKEACRRAVENKRNTVMGKDL
jgi:histone H3/H4